MNQDQSITEFADQVAAVLNEIRPALQIDGGDVELVSIDGKNVELRLSGPYIDGPYTVTLIRMGIERKLRDHISSLGKVITVNTF